MTQEKAQPKYQVQYIARSLEDTERVAISLLEVLQNQGIIALTGNLGGGKTAFVQLAAKQLGIKDAIASPTFTLINEYEFKGSHRLAHSDFYRLSRNEIIELGLDDYFHHPKTLVVVEWANRLESIFPPQTVWIDFALIDDYRVITLHSENESFWQEYQKKFSL